MFSFVYVILFMCVSVVIQMFKCVGIIHGRLGHSYRVGLGCRRNVFWIEVSMLGMSVFMFSVDMYWYVSSILWCGCCVMGDSGGNSGEVGLGLSIRVLSWWWPRMRLGSCSGVWVVIVE